jgi:transposase
MCRSWNSVIKSNFPKAKTIIDAFHAIKRIQKKLYDNEYVPLRKHYLKITENKEDIAKRTKKENDKQDAVKARKISSHVFKSRFLWRKGKENICTERKKDKPSEKERLDILFEIDAHFKETYELKEKFRDIYKSKNRKEAEEMLKQFRALCVDNYKYLIRTLDQNEAEILNLFTEEGTVDVKHWPEQLIEQMRAFEQKRGAFRTLNSWKMLIDLLLERIQD